MNDAQRYLFRKKLGATIRSERFSAEITQAELAAFLGIGRTSVSEIESGRRGVLAEELVMTARRFGVTVERLLAAYPAEAARGEG